jgi:hypothetical protein
VSWGGFPSNEDLCKKIKKTRKNGKILKIRHGRKLQKKGGFLDDPLMVVLWERGGVIKYTPENCHFWHFLGFPKKRGVRGPPPCFLMFWGGRVPPLKSQKKGVFYLRASIGILAVEGKKTQISAFQSTLLSNAPNTIE